MCRLCKSHYLSVFYLILLAELMCMGLAEVCKYDNFGFEVKECFNSDFCCGEDECCTNVNKLLSV